MDLKGRKVVVAMSGGVDSSVAAALLLEQGAEVVGCFMRLGSEDDPAIDNLSRSVKPNQKDASCKVDLLASQQPRKHKQGCCSVNDAQDGRLVAAHLGIPFYVLNFKRDFGRVIDYFVSEYNKGRTPNPCVRCNDWLKFGKLHAYAQSLGADFVASGHYARIDHTDPMRPRLLRGLDERKDQSYVLFGVSQQALRHMLLPIGELDKSVVRQMAEDRNLPVFDKPDSQEICFVPDQDYARLVAERTEGGFQTGAFLNMAGEKVGEHAGHQHYTLGQRRGLPAMGTPHYVIAKDPQANSVTIGPREALLNDRLIADQVNWLVPMSQDWISCQAKIRYNSPPTPAQVRGVMLEDGREGLEVRFDQPVEAITPGQAVVCFDNDQVLCGGWIDSVL